MEYRLDLNPAVLKKGRKYVTIHITDGAFHTAAKTATPSVGNKIRKAVDAGQPGRIYGPIDLLALMDSRAYAINRLKEDPDFVNYVRDQESKGYKVLLSFDRAGVPVGPGKDTVEFLNSKNGKRVLRGLAKKKREE
ncbi:MAG: hypothetical protein V4480_03060 [Patescibacteria group bacterium]